jgi:hypothetical protein
MVRGMRVVFSLVAIGTMTARDARAQWRYGGWGWGGWGGASTPVGAAREGAGYYAMGAGMYNLETAQARSINANTVMNFNDYVARSALESAYMYNSRKNAQFAKDRSLYDAHQKKIRQNPDQHDVESGDALNAAITDLNNPKLGPSAVRAASIPVPASLIAEVPFEYAADAVTFMLDGLRKGVKWPEVFEDKRFADDEKTFDEIAARIRREAQDGEVKLKSLREAKEFVDGLRAKVDAQPLADPDDQADAVKFLTSCSSLIGLLKKPDIQPALLDLRKVKDTTIGNLLGFMHAYNLRFGVANTPKQREAYQTLYGILDQTRAQILGGAQLEANAGGQPNPGHAHDFFQSLGQGRP